MGEARFNPPARQGRPGRPDRMRAAQHVGRTKSSAAAGGARQPPGLPPCGSPTWPPPPCPLHTPAAGPRGPGTPSPRQTSPARGAHRPGRSNTPYPQAAAGRARRWRGGAAGRRGARGGGGGGPACTAGRAQRAAARRRLSWAHHDVRKGPARQRVLHCELPVARRRQQGSQPGHKHAHGDSGPAAACGVAHVAYAQSCARCPAGRAAVLRRPAAPPAACARGAAGGRC